MNIGELQLLFVKPDRLLSSQSMKVDPEKENLGRSVLFFFFARSRSIFLGSVRSK